MSRYHNPKSCYCAALLAITLVLLTSCSANRSVNTSTTSIYQSGEMLEAYLTENSSFDPVVIENALQNYRGPDRIKNDISQYKSEIISLYLSGALALGAHNPKAQKNNTLSSLSIKEATALFALFPIDSAKWMKLIFNNSSLSRNEIFEAAILADLDPSEVFAATASGFTNTVTPLIQSMGIVIYGQNEYSTNSVRFRAVAEEEWSDGFPLSWEPVFGAISGSIVHLLPDTTYDIEVSVTDKNRQTQVYRFQESTQPNSPPIDPEKIYYLSDIYSDGQLDLVALNIFGNEDGYAKIIGDGPIIDAGDEFFSAVNIGAQSYVMLENIKIKGGNRYGIYAKKSHHIWIKGCEISKFGRKAGDIRKNIAYPNPNASSPINYDSGIYLERSGIVVIEECEVHSPNVGANNWGDGHPKGANALQVWAYHDKSAYRGQIIVRNNRFYGADQHRFNDVVEGRKNFERRGGFVRDSAVYGNYFAYANDDLIEIDGGQQNVLVYDNEMEQGYVGISIAPNMLGPSYLFHNKIHNLGDERGKQWTAIKAGGLISKPSGQTFVFENFINDVRNGIGASKVNNDTTFWVTSQNNVYFTKNTGYSVGYCIFDKEKYFKSSSTNDLCYNRTTRAPRNEFDDNMITTHPRSNDESYFEFLRQHDFSFFKIEDEYKIQNFSRN